jgi:hypothetical protein
MVNRPATAVLSTTSSVMTVLSVALRHATLGGVNRRGRNV